MPVNYTRQQFRCINCGGRAWLDSASSSTCYKCRGNGEPVPEDEQVSLRQFQCAECDGRAWYEWAERSKCNDCDRDVDPVPKGEEIEYRQFVCENDDCKECGHRWEKMARRSKCRSCEQYGTMVPTGEEEGVFICKILCDCEKENCACAEDPEPYDYTVRCRMRDTAECYRCKRSGHVEYHVKPYAFRPLHHGIKKTSDNVHSCSRCNRSRNCLNFA